jgi:hypothetical protein
VHPAAFKPIQALGGYIIVFKRYLLQPEFPRDKFKEIVNMGIPLGVYKLPPEFLVGALLKAIPYLK